MLPLLLALAATTLQLPDTGLVAPGRGAPTVPIPRLETDARVDGLLDEAAWRVATVLTGFSQYEPVDGRPAEERTEVRVWYAPDALWLGIRAWDSSPGSVRATNADRDAIDSDDHVLVYLDTFDDRRRAYFFAVNPLGVQQDGVRTEGAQSAGRVFGGNIDKNPDFIWDSSGRLTDDGWVVEIRIPFKSLRFPATDEQRWGINVVRKVQRTGYTDTWTDVRRANASFLRQSGAIEGLRDLERGVVVEAQPFVTAGWNGVRREGAAFDRDTPEPDAGLNLRLGWTTLTVDATLNPDFSQVESDAGQVTVNERFALFFPEKRPFFQEGIELFATPQQLIYTRRIVDPIVGGKVTGKLGPLGVAHLTAVDDAPDGDALFNVTRLRRDIGESSLAGLTYTDRTLLQGSAFNRVLAADARLVFGGMYYVQGQLGGSWTGVAGATEGAPVWQAQADRTGRSFGFNWKLAGTGEDFVAAAGFVPRTGIVDGHAFHRLTWYGERGALVENVTAFFGPTRIWRYGDFLSEEAIEGSEFASLQVRLRGGWQIETRPARSFVRLDPDDYQGYGTAPGEPTGFLPLARVAGLGATLKVETPTWRRLEAEASVGRGRAPLFQEGSEGTSASASASVLVRPTDALRVTGTASWQRLTRDRDGSSFATALIPRAQLEYQPTRALFFRVIGEYRHEDRAALRHPRTGMPLWVDGRLADAVEVRSARVDLLASFEPSPGTVAFLGYGSALDAPERRFGALERQRDGFFLKLAYQLRW
ncbi:MAG TPA: DUF5916 domain-containing protein [Longimicrobiales bacterium]|nr:DUF5916 domain-containing protein [Longimicrobiales bacterium]